jgi:L-fuconolactonase
VDLTATDSEERRMIIDCHVHVWELPPIAPVGPTAPTWTAVTEEAGPVELLIEDMNANSVDAAVLVQSSGSTWDNTYVADSANRNRERFRSIGLINPMDTGNAEVAARWMDDFNMSGFRFHPDYYPQHEVLDPDRNDALFRAIEARGGIVKAHNRVGNVGQIARTAPRYPDITWIIDHMMYPEPWMSSDGWNAYLPVLELASNPNVVMTISDVHNRSGKGYPYPDMHSAVMMAIDAFGIERCIWGTGYPGYLREKNGWITLADELRLVREGFDWLSDSDRAKLLGENARQIYQF